MHWYHDPLAVATTVATIVIGLATVVSLWISSRMWKVTRKYTEITKDIFEASSRPYVGVTKLSMTPKEAGFDPLPVFEFDVTYKNVGSVPALEVRRSVTVMVDGKALPPITPEESPAVLMPESEMSALIYYNDPQHFKAIESANELTLIFSCTYRGVTEKEYRYEQKAAYDPAHNKFYVVKAKAT
jgi:archaellum component FlaG (FlaF/FlaG flagellin family)